MKKLSPEEFKEIYSKVPRLCVDLIIKDQEGVLLTKRSIPPYLGNWHLPGGTVLFGESIQESIQRVSIRELGIGLNVKNLLGFMEFDDWKNGGQHAISLVFLCELKPGKIVLNDEATEFIFTKNEIKNIIPTQLDFIKKHNLL
ncbi:MAG: NUDIX hydrolase [Nanoarchaeota archaeon]